jgi:hypothetical protein
MKYLGVFLGHGISVFQITISEKPPYHLHNILLTAISSFYDKDLETAHWETFILTKKMHYITESGSDLVFR